MSHPATLAVRCIFRLGTPPQPYAVIENVAKGIVYVVRISEDIYQFFLQARIPVCELVMVPPASLVGKVTRCVVRMFIGTQDPVPYAIVEAEKTGEFNIIQITEPVDDLFRFLGVPLCQLISPNED